MLHSRGRLAALAAACLLALSACSDDPASTASDRPAPDVMIRAATAQTTGAGSSKFALTSTTAIGDQDVTLAGEGAYDYARKTGQLVFQVPGAEGETAGGTIQQRILGEDVYLTLPEQPEVFYKLLVNDVAGTALGSSIDPTATLQTLTGVAQATRVGEVKIREQKATHYRGQYDVAQALAQAQGPAKAILQATLGRTTQQQIPFEAYLDSAGRVVKFEQRLELPPTQFTANKPIVSTFTLELYEFGTVVTVVAPPGEAIRDGAPLLAALREVTPQAPPPPVPPAPAPAEPAPVPPPAEPAPVPPPAPAPPAPPAAG